VGVPETCNYSPPVVWLHSKKRLIIVFSCFKHDVLFLVTIRANPATNHPFHGEQGNFRQHFGVVHVRGCEIKDLIGPDGKVMDEFTLHKGRPQFPYTSSFYTLKLFFFWEITPLLFLIGTL